MKKKWLIFNCITLMLFCQGITGVSAISDAQKGAIVNNCLSIKESLKTTQRVDARTRVYLGGKFETILSKYITPLNIKLVEKNISDADLLKNQSDYAEAKATFSNDFIKYQQSLEELVGINCQVEPEIFYDKLLVVRERRRIMSQDIVKLKTLTLKNIELVTAFRSGI